MTDFNFLLDKEVVISGIQINYYFVCPTELWFFSHHLSMEHSS
ncbi:MAG: Dna2/Cas4 domain-containing protein, partial [Candidatus Ratteibacteria bacterium]